MYDISTFILKLWVSIQTYIDCRDFFCSEVHTQHLIYFARQCFHVFSFPEYYFMLKDSLSFSLRDTNSSFNIFWRRKTKLKVTVCCISGYMSWASIVKTNLKWYNIRLFKRQTDQIIHLANKDILFVNNVIYNQLFILPAQLW